MGKNAFWKKEKKLDYTLDIFRSGDIWLWYSIIRELEFEDLFAVKKHGHDYNCWMHLTALDLIALTDKKKILWMRKCGFKEELPNASENAECTAGADHYIHVRNKDQYYQNFTWLLTGVYAIFNSQHLLLLQMFSIFNERINK